MSSKGGYSGTALDLVENARRQREGAGYGGVPGQTEAVGADHTGPQVIVGRVFVCGVVALAKGTSEALACAERASERWVPSE